MRVFCLTAAILALASLAHAQDEAHLNIYAETRLHSVAGMPAPPPMPNSPAGPKAKAVPEAKNNPSSTPGLTPQHALTMILQSPGMAPADAKASVVPPRGLKGGASLDLQVYQRSPANEAGPAWFNPDSIPGFVVKRYWGSSATVNTGQPQTLDWSKLTPDQKAMLRQLRTHSSRLANLYKPDRTLAVWPAKDQSGELPPDASLTGTFTLSTSYAGNGSIDVPQTAGFLPPIQMVSPSLNRVPDLSKPLELKWGPIPSLQGMRATMVGMRGKDTMVVWTCSDRPEDLWRDYDYLSPTDIPALVKSAAMLPGDATTVTVPAGIFEGCDGVLLSMIGYGPAAALDTAKPQMRVETKTVLTAILTTRAAPGGTSVDTAPPAAAPPHP